MTEIEIDKHAVSAGIERITGYTGVKTDDGSAYLRIATTDADSILLDQYFREGIDAIAYMLRHSLVDIASDDDSVRLMIEASAAFDTTLLTNVQNDLTHYMVHSVTARWFALTKPDAAAEHAEIAATLLDSAARMLCHKKKPRRPRFGN